MAIQFSRSIRSLKNERNIAGFVVLASAGLVVAAWLLWFFFAPITLYEESSNFTVRRDGLLLVHFSEAALERILPGQAALFFPTTSQDQLGSSIPAQVMDTPASTGREDGLVHVYLKTSTQAGADLTGQVRIAVEQLSPLSLILRSRR